MSSRLLTPPANTKEGRTQPVRDATGIKGDITVTAEMQLDGKPTELGNVQNPVKKRKRDGDDTIQDGTFASQPENSTESTMEKITQLNQGTKESQQNQATKRKFDDLLGQLSTREKNRDC